MIELDLLKIRLHGGKSSSDKIPEIYHVEAELDIETLFELDPPLEDEKKICISDRFKGKDDEIIAPLFYTSSEPVWNKKFRRVDVYYSDDVDIESIQNDIKTIMLIDHCTGNEAYELVVFRCDVPNFTYYQMYLTDMNIYGDASYTASITLTMKDEQLFCVLYDLDTELSGK